MDISQLQLKIDKNQAVTDLKNVEGQLNKTATAGDSLIGTLKDIGLSIGFGKLVKDTLKLNVEMKAIEKRFKTVFGKDAPIEGVKELTSQFNLSNHEAKHLLSYIGQFSNGLKQTSAFTKNFSVNLAKAATDYATYMGGLDVNDVAKKMAKATLGETGELKEIGIVIDAQSASFKNLTKNIQEQYGVTEAQAKQMAIYKRLLEETAHVAGASQENMMDGFTQLTSLLNNFKEVLAKVGQVFSAIFAPGLNFINSILSTKLGQWATAATISLTSLSVGLYSILNLFEKLKAAINAARIAREFEKVVDIHKQWIVEAEKVDKIQNRIYKILKASGNIGFTDKANFSDLSSGERQKFQRVLELLPTPKFNLEWKKAQWGFEGLKKQLKDLNIYQSELNTTMKDQVGNTWKYLLAERALTTTRITATAATLAQNAAEKINLIYKLMGGGKKIIDALKHIFNGIWSFITTFFKVAGKALIGILAEVLAYAAILVAVFDSFKIIGNLFSGKKYWEGTIIGSGWDKLGWWMEDGDKAVETSKKLDEQFKILREQKATWNSLMKELDDIKFGESLKNLNLDQEITKLQDRRRQIEESLQNTQSLVNDYIKRSLDTSISQEERNKAADLRNEAQAKYNQLLREKISIDDRIASKQKEINNISKQYAKDITDTVKRMNTALQSFSFGRKDGIFQNLAEQAKQAALYNRSLVIQEKLRKLSRSEDLDSLKDRKELTSELFDVTKESLTYQMDALNKQRLAAIENLKAMQALVNESMKLKSTLQTGVDANSQESVRLQSRRLDLSAKNLAPLVEQQSKIKDIEEQMLQKQSSSETILRKVGQDLTSILKKIAEGSTGRSVKLDVVEVKY